MQHAHLTREGVDLFLEEEDLEVTRQIFLHLLAVCPECYKAGGAILEAHLAGDLPLDFDGFDAGAGRAGMKQLELADIAKLMAEAQALFDEGTRDEDTMKKILGLLAQGLYALSLNLRGAAAAS